MPPSLSFSLFPYTTLFRSPVFHYGISRAVQPCSNRICPGICTSYCLGHRDRKSTRLNSSHVATSYAVFCLKKKTGSIVILAYDRTLNTLNLYDTNTLSSHV